MGSETPPPHQVPVVDFSGLDPASPGTDRWVAAREQVMRALGSFDCFEAVCDEITPEVWEAVFGGAMKEVFGLPKEVKLRNNIDKPFYGYVGGIPGMDYESLAIDNAAETEGIEKFADLMWPEGNPSFSATLCPFAKTLTKLEQIVRRMLMESLGVDKYFDSIAESSYYSLRISEYGAPNTEGQDRRINLPAHTDPNVTSIVCQHQVEGLEIQSKDGKWMMPSKTAITFMTGDAFLAWTNGRIEPSLHRVTVSGTEKRYSAILGSHPKQGHFIKAPEELVDDEHPMQYKPYNYHDYLQFRFSQAGKEADCILKAFCGV